MRWALRISFILLLAWAIFLVSPFFALYDLSKAVEAKDIARITERVNFNALRVSLSRQILGDYLETQDLKGIDPQLAARAGTATLNPILEKLITPEAVIDLLEDGQLQQAGGVPDSSSEIMLIRFDVVSVGEIWRTFIRSETHGFRTITIPVPVDEAKNRQFGVTLRLRGTTWRLTGIELPALLREELVKRAAAAAT